MNIAASRAHSIFTLYVSTAPLAGPEDVTTSTLTFVDLAGSERLSLLDANNGAPRGAATAPPTRLLAAALNTNPLPAALPTLPANVAGWLCVECPPPGAGLFLPLMHCARHLPATRCGCVPPASFCRPDSLAAGGER